MRPFEQRCTVRPRCHRRDYALTTMILKNPVQASITVTLQKRNSRQVSMEQTERQENMKLKRATTVEDWTRY